MSKMIRLGLFLISFSLSAFALSSVELVQSVPLETDIAVAGVRDAQTVWVEMIKNAKRTLDIEQFYISDQAGEALVPVLQEIRNAAKRGVKIRLVADTKFFKNYPDSVKEIGTLANSEARLIDFGEGVQHAKFFIVDGGSTFVGSQNFDWRALSHIHEMGLKVDDTDTARNLQAIFEIDWKAAKNVSGANSAEVADVIDSTEFHPEDLTLVGSPANLLPKAIGNSADAIVELMKGAKHSIRVEVMTYLTSKPFHDHAKWVVLDSALRDAAGRGVKVQLMVDSSSVGKSRPDLVALAKVKNIEVKSITIPAFSGGKIEFGRLIHSKFMVVDDNAAWLGTENWTSSYFQNSRDVGFIVKTPTVVTQLGQAHEKLWNASYAAVIN